jgi:nicotinamide mononucleotide transporter
MIEYLFAQYKNYPTYEIWLEIIAITFGLLSVWYAKKDNILVFPTGLINTSIYVFLLWKWSLLGDMIINGYYFVISIYGWYIWTQKKDNVEQFPIARINFHEKKIAAIIFFAAIFFVIGIYLFFNKFNNWMSYIDTLITGIFFVAMWLMARRKIENWLFWIVGNLISIPLYFAKGYTFTSLQYLIFTIVAIFAYLEWKKILNNNQQLS